MAWINVKDKLPLIDYGNWKKMIERTINNEFVFIKEKLERLAKLLVTKKESDLLEAMFLLGCVHGVCCENINYLRNIEK